MTQNPKTSLKKSNIPWIWEIPEYWDVVRIKNICDIQKTEVGKESYKYSLLSLTLQGIKYRDIESGFWKFPAEFDTYQIVDEGDLIFCLFDIEETPRTIGLSDKHWMITGAYTVVKMKSGISNAYYYYLFLSADIEKRLKIYYSGLRNTIKDDNFRAIPVPLPPLPTQTLIANFLDQKTTEIKKFIENKKKLIELLKEQKQSIIHRAVTKGIDPNAKMKESGIPWIGEIPEKWNIVPFSKYFTSMIDYRWKTPEKVDSSEFILVTTRNIKDGIIDYNLWLEYVSKDWYEESRSRWLPKKWDIIFTMEAPLWECALVDNEDVTFWQRIVKFRLNHLFIPEYTIYSMRSFFFQSILQVEATGSTVLGLKSSKVHKLKFILPGVEDQRQIVEYIKKETSQIDSAISKIEQEIALIEEYQTSLIYQAVTGKLPIPS